MNETIISDVEGDVRMEDLIPNDGCVKPLPNGFIKRMRLKNSVYKIGVVKA